MKGIKNFNKFIRVHFIGIGGIGISAVARMFLAEGKDVSGSDRDSSEITRDLEKIGCGVKIGHKASNVNKETELVIYSIAISDNNPELKKARLLNIPCISYPESLSVISRDKFTIAVAGTHGKTTTTAMIAKIMTEAGLSPSVIVGSLIKSSDGSKTNYIHGKSKYLVVEACEYRKSFLNIKPDIAVVTNIDNDHLDYYGSIKNIEKAFVRFAAGIKESGCLVSGSETISKKIFPKNFKIKNYDNEEEKDIKLIIPGRHNILNAKAALAVSDLLGINRKNALKSLSGYGGVWRRFEFIGETASRSLIYVDYAHHPTEIKATLSGAREMYSKNKISVVFQPHLYSRTKILLEDFARAFDLADEVILAPIYAAREKKDPKISSEIVGEKISEFDAKKKVVVFKTSEQIIKYLKPNLGAGNVLIVLGAGDLYTIAEELILVKNFEM